MEKQRERMEEERAVAVAALEGKVKSLDGVVEELGARNALPRTRARTGLAAGSRSGWGPGVPPTG